MYVVNKRMLRKAVGGSSWLGSEVNYTQAYLSVVIEHVQ